jgi:hypothetical protein
MPPLNVCHGRILVIDSSQREQRGALGCRDSRQTGDVRALIAAIVAQRAQTDAAARLEHRLGPAADASRRESYQRRLAAITVAQLHGQIPTIFTPAQIVRLIESPAVGWTTTTSAFLAAAKDDPLQDPEAYREVVVESVRRLLT